MENQEEKYYELNDEQRRQRRIEAWNKFKPTFKKIVFIFFVIAICLLMILALFGTRSKTNSESTSNAICFLNLL